MHNNLGKKAKDKVTGFAGIIIGHADYLTGCDQFLVQPECESDKSHTKPDGQWIDEGRLEILEEKLTSEDVKADKNGCDIPAPMK